MKTVKEVIELLNQKGYNAVDHTENIYPRKKRLTIQLNHDIPLDCINALPYPWYIKSATAGAVIHIDFSEYHIEPPSDDNQLLYNWITLHVPVYDIDDSSMYPVKMKSYDFVPDTAFKLNFGKIVNNTDGNDQDLIWYNITKLVIDKGYVIHRKYTRTSAKNSKMNIFKIIIRPFADFKFNPPYPWNIDCDDYSTELTIMLHRSKTNDGTFEELPTKEELLSLYVWINQSLMQPQGLDE